MNSFTGERIQTETGIPLLFSNLKFGVGPGHRVTWYIGGISWLPVVKMSWGKKSKKKPCVLNNFCFLFNFEVSNID